VAFRRPGAVLHLLNIGYAPVWTYSNEL